MRMPPVAWVLLPGLLLWVQSSVAQQQCNGSFAVRLARGLTSLEGRVEFCSRLWITTCGDGWGTEEAAVVCRELGYSPEGAVASIGRITPDFLPIRFSCTGNEARLRDCPIMGITECSGEAAVFCQAVCESASGSGLIEDDGMLDDEDFQEQGRGNSTCGPSEWFCASGSVANPCNFCIPESAVCDTIPDCRDRTDETYCAPPPLLVITHREGPYFVGSSLTITCRISVQRRALTLDPGLTVSAAWTGPDGTMLSNSSRVTVSPVTMISSRIYQTAVTVLDLESSVDSGSYTCSATLTPQLDKVTGSSATRTTNVTVEVPSCTDRSLRLVNMGNTSGLEGRVEICYNGQWGTVCGSLSSNVVCRQLGHAVYGSRAVSVTRYGIGSGPIWLNFIRCDGTETEVSECAHRGVGVTEACSHSRDIAIECQPAANCSDGEIRLVDGSTEYNGWVQICFSKTWGTICSNLWDSRDASVACNQLGYSAIGASGSQGSHSPLRGPVWMERVMCNGTETSIVECGHNRIQRTSCGRNDAQAICHPRADCKDGDVRLVNGSTASEGRVEFCINSTWGKICPRGFYGAQAAVVCRQLGFPTSGARILEFEGQTLFGRGTRLALLSTSMCNGTESSILDCRNTMIELTEDCSFYGYDATMRCGNASNCTDGDIRTAVIDPFSSPRVEVCFGGEWGFVCADGFSWSRQEGLVACRQLGFKGIESSSTSCCRSEFDLVYTPYLLSNVDCNGTESNLIECSSSGLRLQNCQSGPATLRCSDPPPCVSPGEHECQFGTPYGRSPCISETRLCDGYADCNGGTDEMNCPGIITVGWSRLELSAHESGRSAHRSICLQVLQGVVVQPISVTIYCDSETAKAGIDFKNFTANITFDPGETIKCHLFNASDIIMDDLLLEFTEYFNVYASPAGDDYRFVEVAPDRSTATIFITDDEIVQVGFDSPVYSVNEGDGEVRISVRRFGEGVELGRPITVRVSSSEGNATAGTDYEVRGVLPQIAELGAHSSPSYTWDIFIPIVDDSVSEGFEVFTVELFVNDVAVTTMQTSSTIVIVDDDDESVPEELNAYFTGDTPRVEGSTVIFQVETNKPASVRCLLTGGIGAIACTTGQTTTTGSLPPGTYTLRAIANTESQRAVAAITVTIPDELGTCTVNLINRGVRISEDTVTIEFGGAGPLSGYSCSLDRQPSKPCTSPLQLSDMSEGDHILRVTTEGCGVNKSGRMILRFTV